MTTMTLFGLALAPLYAAIAQVESDNGKTSANVYQIDEDGHGYTDDVNRILMNMSLEFTPYDSTAKLSCEKSESMMYIYWRHWGLHYQHKTGKPVTYEVLARIHNGGQLGWKKESTVKYWLKVKAAMEGGAK